MRFPKKIAKRARNWIYSLFFNQNLNLGKEVYLRRRLLPNLLSRTLRHEEFLDDIFRAALQGKDGAIIDVGVNTGQTLFKILSIEKNREYFGFEPQSMAASCVESFLIENKITNCRILPVALSDQNGIIPLHIRGGGIHSMASSSASIVTGFRPHAFYHYTKYIYAVQGDDVIESLGIRSIALIKIDVEGAELEVLKGIKKTIKGFRPFILFEVLHHYLVVTGEELDNKTIDFRETRIQELEEIIRSNGYQIYQIYGKKEIVRIDKIQPRVVNDLSSTDFIAVPEENEHDFCRSLGTARRILRDSP